MPDGSRRRVTELDREIAEHAGTVEARRLWTFWFTLQVFRGNAEDLLALLDAPNANHDLSLALVIPALDRETSDHFNVETSRCLHNYVAGTMSLVEHARRLARGRPVSAELAERVAALPEPEIKFVQDLRNFMLHRTLPTLTHRLSIRPHEGSQVSRVQLDVAELREWGGWTAPAQGFLDGQGKSIDLRAVIDDHCTNVDAVNTWLLEQLRAANADAVVRVNRLIDERNAIANPPADAEPTT